MANSVNITWTTQYSTQGGGGRWLGSDAKQYKSIEVIHTSNAAIEHP